MTIPYIISQIFVVINYLLVGSTYLVKKRKLILCLSTASFIANGIAFFLLSAWSGLAMCGVGLLRNIILLIQNHFDKENKNKILNWSIFAFLVVISAVSGYFTYNGLLSLFSVFATFVFTVSIWQKNQIVYKILGILCSCLWIIYNIFVWSIFGIAGESVLLAVEIIGLVLALIKLKRTNKNSNETEVDNTSETEVSSK